MTEVPKNRLMTMYCASVTPRPPTLVRKTWMCFSSHCARKKAPCIVYSKMMVAQPGPSSSALATLNDMTTVTSASHPWSNSWPSGLDEPVRRACLPSMESIVL